MATKSFKDNPALAFIGTQQADNTADTQKAQSTPEAQPTYYRLNLKLRGEFRQYLDDESWKARISMTEYINRLIEADMAAKMNGQAT